MAANNVTDVPDYLTTRQIFNGFRLPPATTEVDFLSATKYQPLDDDLFVVSFPKSGTTWMQYIVCLIYKDGVPPLGPIMFGATPFLEYAGGDGVAEYERPTPIKTHFPYELTPIYEKAKYIYVARNPKDTLVSYYYHNKLENCKQYQEMTFDEFFEMFIEGTTDWNDYYDHILSWYPHKDDPNVLFVTYEDMKEDIRSVIQQVALFMGGKWSKCIEDDDLMDKIILECSLPVMKKNVNETMAILARPEERQLLIPPKMNRLLVEIDKAGTNEMSSDWQFVRKGVVGDWKGHLSQSQNERLSKRTNDRLSSCTQLLARWPTD